MNRLLILASAGPPPAGGAELGQIVIATVAATIVTAALLYLGFGHRSGRVAILGRLAAFAERRTGMPGWTSLPASLATGSLIIALFGMYWDISLHIDDGRDPGPLANPAHYFILLGLFGIFTAGFVAMVLPRERPSAAAIRLGRDWWAPLGGVLICACGAFSLIGFPLDDMWHRVFGQDVTLWGPTHLMLIGGAAMALIGIAVLTVEGLRARAEGRLEERETSFAIFARVVALNGGLLVGLSTFQAEFDFGVPQFQLIFQPMLIMFAAGLGLVLARIFAGRGGAIGAVAFFLLMRGGLAVLVGPVLGETTPHLPLYVLEGLVVEAIALVAAPPDRPLRFGLLAGIGIGTVGLAAEWAWTQVAMPLPWNSALVPVGVLFGFGGALCGSLIGAWAGSRLSVEPGVRRPLLRGLAACSALVLAGMTLFALQTPGGSDATARVALHDVPAPGGRQVDATIRLRPADAAAGADWFDVTAWQGGGRLVLDRLDRVGPGEYRTTKPIPVHGSWKTMIRLHTGHSLLALPIFLPRDEAIPVGELPAPPVFTRHFRNEHEILQREQKGGGPLLVALAYSTVAGITLGLLALLAWGLHRLAFGPAQPRRRRRRRAALRTAP